MKRIHIGAAALIVGFLSLGQASAHAEQSASAARPAAGAQAEKLSTESTVGELLDYAPAKAVLVKHMPAIAKDDQIEQARNLSFRALQQFAPDAITDELLAAIEADLAKLPPPPAAPARAK